MQNRQISIADGHADILCRMASEGLDFWSSDSELQMSNLDQMLGGVQLQSYAIFPDPKETASAQLREVLRSIDIYREQIVAGGFIHPIETKTDLLAMVQYGTRGGLLALEGAHCLDEDLSLLCMLYRLGVRSVGLTWNFQNCIATGVKEQVDHGLTLFGKEAVSEMQKLGMLVDVAHLSRKGVDQVLEQAQSPVICSHANSYTVFAHERNLPDEQVKGIAATGGYIGVTFVPYFIANGSHVSISDLIRHVDHLLNLVGPEHVALGSDFDGITETMVDLMRGRNYPLLMEVFERRYGLAVTEQIASANVFRVLAQVLPDE